MKSDPSPSRSSVGFVRTQRARMSLPPEGFRLVSGQTLPELEIAYETYGTLNAAGDNAIYICHALTMDAHAAGFPDGEEGPAGWWEDMVGPGKGIDTDRFFVICGNILGGCKGTTGPSSTDPRTGKPYGGAFPEIAVRDIVEAQRLLVDHLGIARLCAVVGGSLGGMQALEWAVAFPERVQHCICIASAMRLATQALSFDIVGRKAIEADPRWRGGEYAETGAAPAAGLGLARMIGHITYLSPEMMTQKFGRERRSDDRRFQVESYLDYQAERFVERFDANSYVHITRAMDAYDVGEAYGSTEAALARVRARFLVVALSSDWLFPPEQSVALSEGLLRQGKRVSYCALEAPHGHDAFLVDIEHLSDVVKTFLEGEVAAPDAPVDATASGPGADFARIAAMVRPGARVIDLGCGDGELMALLARERGATSLGIDIDLPHLIRVVGRGLDVVQVDVDHHLRMIPDGSYDYAVLSQTLQVVRQPRLVLREMLRIAREGIVSFPNFARWSHRLYLGLVGRMPKTRTLPFEWYETPNIHLATLKDFESLCRIEGFRIVERVCIPAGVVSRALVALGLPNAGADRVLVRIARM